MALTRYVGLMRAVNVGGRKAQMASVRAWLAGLGLAEPRTLLQSGNLVFDSERSAPELEALLEHESAGVLGFATDFLVRTADAWRAVLAANPYPQMARDDPSHLVVMPLKQAPAADAVATLTHGVPGREQATAVGRELYLTYPDGIGDSRLTGAVIERRLGVRGTARNWNTATKLAAMLQ